MTNDTNFSKITTQFRPPRFVPEAKDSAVAKGVATASSRRFPPFRDAAAGFGGDGLWKHVDQPILIVGADLTILDVNASMVALLETGAAGVRGTKADPFFVDPAPAAVIGWIAEHIDSQPYRLMQMQSGQGKHFCVELSAHAYRDDSGKVAEIALVARDRSSVDSPELEASQFSPLWNSPYIFAATLDREGHFLGVNRSLTEHLGYAEAEMIGRPACAFVADGHDRDRSNDFGDKRPMAIARLRAKSGDIVTLKVRKYQWKDARDPRVCYLEVGHDVTAGIRLREQVEIFDTIWNQVRERIAIISNRGRITYCNQAFARPFHKQPAELFGQPLETFSADFNPAVARDYFIRARAGERVSDVIAVPNPQTGTPYWLLLTMIPFASPHAEARSVIAIFLDVTAARNAEVAQKASEEGYEQLLASLMDAVISTTETGKIIAANPATEKLFGYKREELMGRPLDILLPEHSRKSHQRLMSGYAAGNERSRSMANFREVEGVTKSGKEVFLEIAIDQTGVPGSKRLTAIIRDVTQRRMLEKRVRHSDKMRAIGQLAAGIAHDFNNVLAVISGSSELGLEMPGDEDCARRMFDRILSSSKLGKDITSKLLTFARGDAQKFHSIDASILFADLQEMLKQICAGSIRIELAVEPGIWAFIGDASQLQNAIINLVLNAKDAMPAGGTLTLKARNCPTYQMIDQYGRNRDTEMVEITVSDTGCGMTEEVRQRALEPFFTTKAAGEGTGLGLATVYGVVQRCGGVVEISSQVNHGTTVRVLLPRSDIAIAIASEPKTVAQIRSPRAVLLVEDNEPYRLTLRDQLTLGKFTVYDAPTAEEAQRLFAQHDDIEVLLTDYRLAEGITGLDLAAGLRGRKPDLGVVIMTGYLELSATGKAPPDFVMLTKPIPVDELTYHLRSLLRRSEPSAS